MDQIEFLVGFSKKNPRKPPIFRFFALIDRIDVYIFSISISSCNLSSPTWQVWFFKSMKKLEHAPKCLSARVFKQGFAHPESAEMNH